MRIIGIAILVLGGFALSPLAFYIYVLVVGPGQLTPR